MFIEGNLISLFDDFFRRISRHCEEALEGKFYANRVHIYDDSIKALGNSLLQP